MWVIEDGVGWYLEGVRVPLLKQRIAMACVNRKYLHRKILCLKVNQSLSSLFMHRPSKMLVGARKAPKAVMIVWQKHFAATLNTTT